MRSSFPIGTVLGIPIRVHVSWFVVLAFATWNTTGLFTEHRHPLAISVLAALLSSLSVFTSVLLHELGHCLAARWFGIHVRRIQLFLFGGVAEIVGEPKRVLDEILIAAAGPAVSFALAAVGFASVFGWATFAGRGPDLGSALGGDVALTILFVVSAANLLLGAFNLVPAFPTDGGRILRATLWGLLGDYRRATAIAAGLGMMFAGGFVLLGLASLTGFVGPAEDASQRFGGVWWALIGLFLARSASQASAHADVSVAIRDGHVRDVMIPVRAAIPADRTLLDVLVGVGGPSASDMLLHGFPVTGPDGRLAGFVEPPSLHTLPREKWGSVRVRDVMTPVATLATLSEADGLDALLRLVAERGSAGALVLREGALIGYAGRAELARWLFRDKNPTDSGGAEP